MTTIIRCEGVHYELCFMGAGTFIGPDNDVNYTSYLAVERHNIQGVLVVRRSLRGVVYSHGTLVRRAYRRQGIAIMLWDAMLKAENPTMVDVQLVSDLGRTLIDGVRTRHAHVNLKLYEAGQRPLRNMKGRAA